MKKYLFILTILVANCSQIKNVDQSDLAFPVYGNYCGPKYPPEGTSPTPLDSVDTACKNHDKCYERYGYFDKMCDGNIIKELKNIKPSTPEEKLARRLIISYFERTQKL